MHTQVSILVQPLETFSLLCDMVRTILNGLYSSRFLLQCPLYNLSLYFFLNKVLPGN